jgi:hypothetical protein
MKAWIRMDPHQSQQRNPDPDPDQSQNSAAVEAQNGTLEGRGRSQ